jgi:DNA repair protein RecO (recombination protein O)
LEQTRAILVRKTLFSESTLICTWISERYGKLKTSARGAKKIKSHFQGLDLFHEVEISFTRNLKSDLHFLQELHITLPFVSSELSYPNLILAAYFGELSEAIIPASDTPAPEVFDLLTRGLRHLRKTHASLRALAHFENSLCKAIGVGGRDPVELLEHYCSQLPRTRAIALSTLH